MVTFSMVIRNGSIVMLTDNIGNIFLDYITNITGKIPDGNITIASLYSLLIPDGNITGNTT